MCSCVSQAYPIKMTHDLSHLKKKKNCGPKTLSHSFPKRRGLMLLSPTSVGLLLRLGLEVFDALTPAAEACLAGGEDLGRGQG